MIVLRNLMLAIAAFFVAGVGFYSYLLKAMPPDQIQSRVVTPSSATASPNANQQASEIAVEQDTSSSWSLLAAVVGDFLAARRESSQLDNTETDAAVVIVPDWLDKRFDDVAAHNDKTLLIEDKARLLATLLELRALRQQQLAREPTQPGSGPQQLPDVGMTARAMQADLQFRQTLGMGLAEFMKQMRREDLARLLSISAPANLSQGGQGSATAEPSVGVLPAH